MNHAVTRKAKEFIEFVYKCDIEWSLEATCKLLLNGDEDTLQHAWIALLAKAGETMSADHVKVWLHISEEVLRQLQQDYLDATEVMILTVMFCCLFRRLKGRVMHTLQIQTLRSRVVHHFPAEAELTEKGRRMYARILSAKRSDHGYGGEDDDFSQKLLVGLTRLWSESLFEDSRMTLEYLSRRKIMMDLPGDFPCASDLQDGDMAWFLWGALLCFYKEHDNVALLWSLFSWDWKKQLRADRIGLLWGAMWCMHPNAQHTIYWTPQETEFLETIQSQALRLWTDYVGIHQPNHAPEAEEPMGVGSGAGAGAGEKRGKGGKAPQNGFANSANAKKVDMLLDFTPRVQSGGTNGIYSNPYSATTQPQHYGGHGSYGGFGGHHEQTRETETREERRVIEVRNDKRYSLPL